MNNKKRFTADEQRAKKRKRYVEYAKKNFKMSQSDCVFADALRGWLGLVPYYVNEHRASGDT